jgi:hypothetical protein
MVAHLADHPDRRVRADGVRCGFHDRAPVCFQPQPDWAAEIETLQASPSPGLVAHHACALPSAEVGRMDERPTVAQRLGRRAILQASRVARNSLQRPRA